jgi:hypothetical protein
VFSVLSGLACVVVYGVVVVAVDRSDVRVLLRRGVMEETQ